MTIKTDHTEIRILDDAELDAVNGGSIVDVVIEVGRQVWNALTTAPRDASTGMASGRRSHAPYEL